jgi:hypothetical protein
MRGEHPSLDLLERYFTNEVSDVETAVVERHVFACGTCFSKAASLDMDTLALNKACSMLGDLESQGTKVLTISAPERDIRYSLAFLRPLQFEFRYAAVAATVLLTVATLSSVGIVEKEAQRISSEIPERIESTAALLPAVPTVEMAPPPRRVTARRRPTNEETRAIIANLRFEKPFMPPSRVFERPEVDMTHSPPLVAVQRRLEPPTVISRLPLAPKRRVHPAKRFLGALATPFKKLGGTLVAFSR